MTRRPLFRRQAGLSLIELMIAMVLGAIVVAGLIQVLLANRKGYQLQESNNFMQQSLRFASDRIGWSVRAADFWGGIKSDQVVGLLGDGSGASGCNPNWVRSGKTGNNGAGGLFGYDGKASFPISGCALVPNSDYVPGSDVLVVRYVDTDPCAVADGSNAAVASCLPGDPGYDAPDYLVANVGQQAQLFAKADSIPVTGDTRRFIYPYRLEAYYLQPCSDRNGGTCSASSDDGTPRPTLMHVRLESDGTLLREPLAEGIEQLQFEYLVAVPQADGTVKTQFKTASNVSASEWPNVRAVRVTMLARSGSRDVSLIHPGTFQLSQNCTAKLDDDGTLSVTSTSDDCTGLSLGTTFKLQQFPRAMMQQVVQVRNRIRG